ncbi:hypothetical protein [Halococcus agarilyticus]|uniref:hypothetical protein n=1 Tax=Halococcus agarilyticus TaxID=1232219 RepID=UPI0006779F65|nr:hypothetical protein [Halococcus agarilyticus]
MDESRRRFVRRAALGATALVAGCTNAGRSGDESSSPTTTTGNIQSTSETAANTSAATDTETTEGTTTSVGDGSTTPNETTLDATTDGETAEIDPTVTETTEPTAPPGPQTTVGDARYVGKFVLWNDDDASHSLSVSITKNGSALLDDTFDLDADSSTRVDNPITKQGSYRIRAETESGASETFTWEIARCSNYEYIQIYIDEESGLRFRKFKQTVDPPPTCSGRITDGGEQEHR